MKNQELAGPDRERGGRKMKQKRGGSQVKSPESLLYHSYVWGILFFFIFISPEVSGNYARLPALVIRCYWNLLCFSTYCLRLLWGFFGRGLCQRLFCPQSLEYQSYSNPVLREFAASAMWQYAEEVLILNTLLYTGGIPQFLKTVFVFPVFEIHELW